MSKRFTDTDKWKKGWIRKLPTKYKLLWVYILDDCNHAGIWDVELEIASLRLGIKVDVEESISAFKGKIKVISNGDKWFIPNFVSFQYGTLNPENRAHNSVIQLLERNGLRGYIRGLKAPIQGRKDMDMDKELDKDKDKEEEGDFNIFWKEYPKKVGKGKAEEIFKKIKNKPPIEKLVEIIEKQKQSLQWNKESGQFIPNPATWLNQKRWDDDLESNLVKTTAEKVKEALKNE